jgi:hypothetical protein
LFFLPVIAFAQTYSYDDAMKSITRTIESKLSGNSPVAIVSFDSSSQRFSVRVINDLTEVFVNNEIIVVDRQHLESIMREQNFHLSGYVSDESAVSIGHMLGAQSILIGSGENMVNYYRMQFRMIGVESSVVQAQISLNVQYDRSMRQLLEQSGGNIGNIHFLVGMRLGTGFEMNTGDEDMVGVGYSSEEKSNIAFNASLYGAFKFNEIWSIQPELIFMVNNGYEFKGVELNGQYYDYTVKIGYTTLDIPLLLRFNFIQEPVLAGALLGPYLSLPVGKFNLTVDDIDMGAGLDTAGISYGITAGFVVAKKIGPGYITGDIRFLHDFLPLLVHEDFGDGVQDAKIGIRRSINLTLGYEFSL